MEYLNYQNLHLIYDIRQEYFNRLYHVMRNNVDTNQKIKHLESIVITNIMHDRNEPSILFDLIFNIYLYICNYSILIMKYYILHITNK